MIKPFIAGVVSTICAGAIIIGSFSPHVDTHEQISVCIYPLLYWTAMLGLSMWAGYQRFMMAMIFNPNSAECEIAQDWPRRKEMKFKERFNYELAIWLYIVFWPLIELTGMAVSAIER